MIPLHFEKLSMFARVAECARVAVPVAEGVLDDASSVVVRDADGTALPTQARVTARWSDGSVKWLLVHMLVDLPGDAARTVQLDLTGGDAPAPAEPVRLERRDGWVSVRNGALTIDLGGPGEAVIAGTVLDEPAFEAGQWLGPRVTCDGVRYVARVGAEGWRTIHDGPVFTSLETRGRHVREDGSADSGGEWLDFALRINLSAGRPWFEAEYRLINREETEQIELEAITWDLAPSGVDPAQVRTGLGHSNYRTTIEQRDAGEPLEMLIDADFLIYQSNEQIPEVHYGTFWADWTGPAGGVCVTQHQAHQNFPKAMRVSGDGLSAQILPPGSNTLTLPRGMAKMHRLQFHLHDASAPLEQIDVRTLQYQMPDRPTLEPTAYREAELFPGIWPKRDVPRVERFLIDLADERTRAYGIKHWGDAPDVGYTHQGRGRGELVWTNNEYDLPHAAMMMYAHTGERRMLDYLLVAAEHQMHIDVCHDSDDPLRHRGQVIHADNHVNQRVSPCHQWVTGLLDYHHQTGDPFALETALGIGENVLAHLERPELREPGAAATRVTGWALRTLMALYEETFEQRWIEPAHAIAQQFRDWHERYGAWVAPYTSHTMARVPFMMSIAACSLMRYWRVTGDRATAELIVAAVDDIITHCLTPDGRFYYKELPSLRRRSAGAQVLESLAYAYELTGDRRFLDAGRTGFEELIGSGGGNRRGGWSGGKYAAGDAVIVPPGPGPKAFPATFMSAITLYTQLVEADMLES